MHPDLLADRSHHILQLGQHDQPHPTHPADAPPPELMSPGAQIATTLAQNHELRAEVEQLRVERNRLLETQHRIMELIGAPSPDKLVHDLRNVLNERDLLKALVDEL